MSSTAWRSISVSILGNAATSSSAGPRKLPLAATAQQQPSGPTGTFLLTVFLKHDQSRPLDALNEQLRNQKYYESFPPDGIEVVSWYVMMGIGQVVTLRVPADRLREVNRA